MRTHEGSAEHGRFVRTPSGPSSLLLNQIELRHLRYVVAVADDLHFARAAQRLHLAAPSLSKQVRQLESRLGYPLFERGTRHVQLTRSGSAFVVAAREALNHVGLALTQSAAVSGIEPGVTTAAYSPWAGLSWIVAARNQLSQATGLSIAVRSESTASQLDSLLTGALDIGIVILPVEAVGLTVRALRREHVVLALPEGHPFSASEAIALKALANEPFIAMDAFLEPSLNRHFRQVCEENGFMPNVVQEVTSVSEAIDLVALNIGITLVRASATIHCRAQGVIYRECAEPDLFVEIGVAYRTQHPPPSIETFIHLLQGTNS